MNNFPEQKKIEDWREKLNKVYPFYLDDPIFKLENEFIRDLLIDLIEKTLLSYQTNILAVAEEMKKSPYISGKIKPKPDNLDQEYGYEVALSDVVARIKEIEI